MKTWFFCATRVLACGLCLVLAGPHCKAADMSGQLRAEAAGHALLGTHAPRKVLKTIDGADIDLGQLYGKQAVYLKFWATWCVPCRQQMPHFEHVYETAGPDLAVIAVNTGFNDSVEEIRKYRKELGITMPIVMDDGTLAGAFHLRVTPQHIVIGRDGRVAYVGHLANGALDAALLAARTAPPSTSSETPREMVKEPPRIEPGDVIGAQRIRTVDGKTLPLVDRDKHRPTLLVFLSPWCESYLETTRPALSASCKTTREQVDALRDDESVRWIGIASGLWSTHDDLRAYAKKYGVRIPLSLDATGTRFREFDVTQIPTVILVDGNGTLRRRLEPADLASHAALRSTLRAAL